jgi:hypothetical protein
VAFVRHGRDGLPQGQVRFDRVNEMGAEGGMRGEVDLALAREDPEPEERTRE